MDDYQLKSCNITTSYNSCSCYILIEEVAVEVVVIAVEVIVIVVEK